MPSIMGLMGQLAMGKKISVAYGALLRIVTGCFCVGGWGLQTEESPFGDFVFLLMGLLLFASLLYTCLANP